jgi:hypothetical protein
MSEFAQTNKTWQDLLLETVDLSNKPVCLIGQELLLQQPVAAHVGKIKWQVGTKLYVARATLNVGYKTKTVEPFIAEEN